MYDFFMLQLLLNLYAIYLKALCIQGFQKQVLLKLCAKRTVVVRFAAVAARCPKNVKERARLFYNTCKGEQAGIQLLLLM